MLFHQPRQPPPPVLSIPSVVFLGSLLVALKRAGLLAMRAGCRLRDLADMSLSLLDKRCADTCFHALVSDQRQSDVTHRDGATLMPGPQQ